MKELLNSARFGPFFVTQFIAAFNDNVFKNALVILIAFRAANEIEAGLWINIASGLFILPYFLFSPIAGQLADKYEKSSLIRVVKFAEIFIMIFGALGFYYDHIGFLIAILFLMGTQSTFFGPVKYSILPQHLHEHEIVTGTSLVEMGTFVSILLGTILGGVLIKLGTIWVCIAIILFAVLGWISALKVPNAPAASPDLKITKNPMAEIISLMELSRQNDSIFYSIFGISWFWFFGATFLAQIPNYVSHTLHADEFVITVFLAIFTLSIAVGSYVFDKLSKGNVEVGLVCLGALGMSFFTSDLCLMDTSYFLDKKLNFWGFLFNEYSLTPYRIMADLGFIGFFGSFFIVPLYTLLQQRSEKESCSRIIAANNIVNALFMVASSVIAMGFYSIGFVTKDILGFLSIMNLFVCLYIVISMPEFFLRFGSWILAKTTYYFEFEGQENIPRNEGAIIISNHISYIDWFILSLACQRPIRFVMDQNLYNKPILNLLFRRMKCIPYAHNHPVLNASSIECIHEALDRKDLVCLFPEGQISKDGKLGEFKRSMEAIAKDRPVLFVPIALNGLWGTIFSRKSPRPILLSHRTRKRVQVRIGKKISGLRLTAKSLAEQVAQLCA